MEETLHEIINAILAEKTSSGNDIDDEWLAKLVRRKNRETHDAQRHIAKRRLLPAYFRMRENNAELLAEWGVQPNDATDEAVIKLLRAKPRRTASGVATITVLTKPWRCSSDCVYCPNDMRMPKSYIADEPACQRAERNYFDPYLQVKARLRVLSDMGHVTDKIELIVLGGTWNDYPKDYQVWFISELFRALNEGIGESAIDTAEPCGHPQCEAERRAFYQHCGIEYDPDALREQVDEIQCKVDAKEITYNRAWSLLYESEPWQKVSHEQKEDIRTLIDLHRLNEDAKHRVVGLVIETRPDLVTPENLLFMRQLGCTKIQMGIQSLDERILDLNERHISLEQIEQAFRSLRLFGFKSHIHYMVNLPGATPGSDKAEYDDLVHDARFIPDEVKLYPCALVGSSRLAELYESGKWLPYSEDQLIDVLVKDVLATPPYTRISRMIRDIPSNDILAGNKKTNLRQMVEAQLESADNVQEMRLREIATDEVDGDDLRFECITYNTTVSEERFLQYITAAGKLCAFLRLSLPKMAAMQEMLNELEKATFCAQTLTPGNAMIREVHVYGKVAQLHKAGESAQHIGLGRKLIEEACEQAKACGYKGINVISAIGTRGYYRRLSFEDAGLYQHRIL